jgi:hypothetical protein
MKDKIIMPALIMTLFVLIIFIMLSMASLVADIKSLNLNLAGLTEKINSSVCKKITIIKNNVDISMIEQKLTTIKNRLDDLESKYNLLLSKSLEDKKTEKEKKKR